MLDRQRSEVAISDRELITRTAEGDRRAFEALVERHAAAVLRVAKAVTGDPALAEDALQQAFLAVYQHASDCRADSSVRAWVLTIARNAAYRIGRKASREQPVEEPLMRLGIEAGWGSEDPEAIALAAERAEQLRDGLSSLSSQDQEVLVLRDMQGLQASEAAAVLGIGERALKSRLHRARLRLAAALRRGTEVVEGARKGVEP